MDRRLADVTDEEYQQDRRLGIVDVEIALLKERSVTQIATMGRIELKIDEHVADEKVTQAVNKNNWDKTNERLDAVLKILNRNKTIIATVVTIGFGLWAIVVAFKDQFIDFFTK